MSILTRLPARRFPSAASAAHAGAYLLGILDAIPGFGLDIQVGMCCLKRKYSVTEK
jgi:hypothetical protein